MLALAVVLSACGRRAAPDAPTLTVTQVPAAATGGAERMEEIAGQVVGAGAGDRVVLYARSGVWWVQPLVAEPFTTIDPNGRWRASTHLGTEYAALLVAADFSPQPTYDALPAVGGAIRAVVAVPGTTGRVPAALRTVRFSGHEWEARSAHSDRGGSNRYDASHVHVDDAGHLHLRLARQEGRWTGAEVSLTRPLGYGTYVFVTRDVSAMDPLTVLGLLTWDDAAAEYDHRELDIEISRWGDPAIDNAQFVVQPYYVPANVRRFAAPAGRLVHTLRWTPGQAAFRTERAEDGHLVAEHTFTTGVPVPGDERVRMHVYPFGFAGRAPSRADEVIVEKFQYLP